MKRFIALIFIALAAVLNSGCASILEAQSWKGWGTARLYDRSSDVVWTAVVDTVHSTGLELISANKETRTVFARRGMSAFSFGENVAVFVDDAGGRMTRVEVANDSGARQTNDFLKALSDRLPLQVTEPMATAADSRVAAALDWVIIRNGPGTWMVDADWDEYIIRVRSLSVKPGGRLRVTGVAVIDSLGTRIAPATYRGALIDGTAETAYRYQKSGLAVKAGASPGWFVAGGVTVGALGAGVAVGSATAGLSVGTGVGAGVGVVASGLLVGGIALAGVGIVRAVDNSRINSEIERRNTSLPLTLANSQESVMHIFFPLAPSPGRVEITYSDAAGEHRLDLDTGSVLTGMHLGAIPVAAK